MPTETPNAIVFGQQRESVGSQIRFAGTNAAPVVDERLLVKSQPWGDANVNHIDIDGHHGQFTEHVEAEAAAWERKLQGFVSGAYTEMDFGADYGAGRNQLKVLFSAVESEEATIKREHQQVIDQNNLLIAKSKELTDYNNRLYGLLNNQQVELDEVARLKREYQRLTNEAETAGLVETVEEEKNTIGDHHETGKRVQVQHINNALTSSFRTKMAAYQSQYVSGGNQIGSQSVIGGGSQQRAGETLVSGGSQFGSQSVIGGGSQQRAGETLVSGGNQFGYQSTTDVNTNQGMILGKNPATWGPGR